VKPRVEAELALLRAFYAETEYRPEGLWVCVRRYPLPPGWSVTETAVAFQIPVGYPGTPPYGMYVPAGLTFKGQRPNNYTEPASVQPSFGGPWGVFSWQPADGQWKPAATPVAGTNLLTWVRGFAARFSEGA
jgi:hypothetical protein